jgi:glucose/arabinose dehydrogenase
MDDTRILAEERMDMQRRIQDLLEMPDGSLLVLVDDKQGELLRLTAEGPAK